MTETVYTLVDTDDPIEGERQVNTFETEESASRKAENLTEAWPEHDREDFEVREVELTDD